MHALAPEHHNEHYITHIRLLSDIIRCSLAKMSLHQLSSVE